MLSAVAAAAQEQTTTQIRSLLGALLFSGEEVEKRVAVLSGGEKSRGALARIRVTCFRSGGLVPGGASGAGGRGRRKKSLPPA